MKKALPTLLLLVGSLTAFGQGRSVSWQKKTTAPYIREAGDTLRVGGMVQLTEGTGTNGQFLYVQMVNAFNEPIKPAESRMAGLRQPILFFKQQDGVTFLFTKFFVANVEAAFTKGEIKQAARH